MTSALNSLVHLEPPLDCVWSALAPTAPFGRRVTVGAERRVAWAWADYAIGLDEEGREVWRQDGDFRPALFVEGGGHWALAARGDLDQMGDQREGELRWLVAIDLRSGAMQKVQQFDGTLQCSTGPHVIGFREVAESPRAWETVCFHSGRRTSLWTRVVRHESFSLSACADEGTLFSCAEGDVVATDLEDGQVVWRSNIEDLGGDVVLDARHLVAAGVCVVSTREWTAAFSVADGRRLWVSELWGPSASYNDDLYVMQPGAQLTVLDLGTGAVRWTRALAPEMQKRSRRRVDRTAGHIATSTSHVWAADPTGTLWAFDRQTGRPEWHHRPNGTVGYAADVAPAISGNRLYIPTFSLDPRFPPSLYCYQQA